MINHFLLKIKLRVIEKRKALMLALAVFMISLISFGLGRLSVMTQSENISIENGMPMVNDVSSLMNSQDAAGDSEQVFSQSGNFVASKNSKYYYLPTCATAKRIKNENKIWFQTEQEAQDAGFVRGARCF